MYKSNPSPQKNSLCLSLSLSFISLSHCHSVKLSSEPYFISSSSPSPSPSPFSSLNFTPFPLSITILQSLMAVPTSAFSIREYALNMRSSTDLTRISWPFSEKVKKEVAEALLPPMDVKKFRWWSSSSLQDQERVIVSEEEGEEVIIERIKTQKICPVCGVFVAATVNAVNAHIDSCLNTQTSKEIRRKNKGGGSNLNLKVKSSRTPKKRSIAEIFAVAPPVKTMIIVNDCCEEEEEEKAIGKQIIRHNNNNNLLKTTSSATSLVSTIKTINTKITTTTTTEQPSILLKKKKKKKKKKYKVYAIFLKWGKKTAGL